jgi:hypothetical protein
MDFQTWLEQRNIDCQELTPELLTVLQTQYEADCQRRAPVQEVLILPIDDCLWPQRGFRVSTSQ